jgi:hypothetical protein
LKNPSRVAAPIERRLHKRRSLFAITPGMPIYRDHIRTAQPTDGDAISALSEASYSRLLAGSYDSGVLQLALPHMIKADPFTPNGYGAGMELPYSLVASAMLDRSEYANFTAFRH